MPTRTETGWDFTIVERIRIWLASKILGNKLWKWFIHNLPGYGSLAKTWDNEADERWNEVKQDEG